MAQKPGTSLFDMSFPPLNPEKGLFPAPEQIVQAVRYEDGTAEINLTPPATAIIQTIFDQKFKPKTGQGIFDY